MPRGHQPPGRGRPGSKRVSGGAFDPGDRISTYEILDLLGTGGMGQVYLARDTRLKRRVALKVLPKDLTDNPTLLQRWRREAETVAGLNHPNIVTLYSVEEVADSRFFTMELVEGRSLDEMIPARGMALGRLFEVAVPLADALAAAHDKGIAHRDLKPSNVMVSNEGRVKVLDFGLAKLVHEKDDDATLTSQGLVIGTLPYMSPEQVQGLDIDLRTDIFSLGVVLYQMAVGRKPFDSKSAAGLASRIVGGQPDDLTERRKDLPRHLARVVHHCLEKKPERRYQSALDVRNELEALKREIETGVVSATIERPQTTPNWRERLGVGTLRALWGLLLPVAALGGLLGKLVIAGLERQVDAQILDRAALAQQPVFWAGAFLEQTLGSVLSPGSSGLGEFFAALAVLASVLVLIARPPSDPSAPPSRWSQLYHVAALPASVALAVAAFFAGVESLWGLAAFVPLLAAQLYYLIDRPEDLLEGGIAQRGAYLLVSSVFVLFLLLVPYRYGRDFFDIHQPPVVERAQLLASSELQSLEQSGQITVVMRAARNMLATIELSDEGKLMSFIEVEHFEPRPQSKNLRELLTTIQASEQHDAEAIAGEWLED